MLLHDGRECGPLEDPAMTLARWTGLLVVLLTALGAASCSKTKKHDHAKSEGPYSLPVRFAATDSTARSVLITGTFSNWQPEAKALHPSGGGRWLKETVLLPGTYEYCLVVDGQWMPDPLAQESVPNPFGGRNSILKVASSPKAAHLADAENLPLKNANKQTT